MKVLITGCQGYIGRHVITHALKHGHMVTTVDLKNPPCEGCHSLEMDLLQHASDPKLYDTLGRPDVICHLAWKDGFNHQAESHIEHLAAHYRFLKNMIDAGCPSLSVMGSMHEVGYWEGMVTAETPCNPLSPYGIAKNALRQLIFPYVSGKTTSLKWLRAFYLTGDDTHNRSIFAKILEMAEKGQKTFPFTSGRNKYDFSDIDDIAGQIIAASTQNKVDGIIHVCSGTPISLKEKVEAFIREKQLSITPEYGAFPDRTYDSPAIWGDTSVIAEIQKGTL